MNLETSDLREQGIASIEAAKHKRNPQELSKEVLGQANRAIDQQTTELKNIVGKDIFNRDFFVELMQAKAELANELMTVSVDAEKNALAELVGEERASELFTDDNELESGIGEQHFAQQLTLLRQKFGKETFNKLLNNKYGSTKDLKDLIEAITSGGAEIDVDDLNNQQFFSRGEPTEDFVQTYRLLKPGLAKDKIEALEYLARQRKVALPEDAVTHAAKKYVRIEDGIGLDKDDKDFILDPELAVNTEKQDNARIQTVTNELRKRTTESLELKEFKTSFDAIFEAGSPLSEKLKDIETSQSFLIFHERFQRSRKINSFIDSLKQKMAPLAAAFYDEAMIHDDNHTLANEDAIQKTTKLTEKAIQIYLEAHQPRKDENGENESPSPIEAIKGFTEWLAQEAESTYKKGEFHVGRDTLMTTFAARQAGAWGKMSGRERAQKIRHVDFSRTLVDNTPKAILASYLRQNGITEDLMGVDTGYRGTGPQDALLAVLPPEKRQALISESQNKKVIQGLSPQIKLMQAAQEATDRTTEYSNKYTGILDWMEVLPKYTERSQYIAKSFTQGSDRLLVVSTERNPSEQLLAWVVQNAVWREFVPKKQSEKQP